MGRWMLLRRRRARTERPLWGPWARYVVWRVCVTKTGGNKKRAECEFRVVPWGTPFTPGYTGYPHAFQWAHRSEPDKGEGVADIVASRQSCATAKPLLKKEMKRCRMLCMCCGKTETASRALAPGPSEEGD